METTPRRSTRQNPANTAAVASSSTQQQDTQQQEQVAPQADDDSVEDEFQAPQAGKRKRKAPVEKEKDAKTEAKPAKKTKLRKGQGVLKQILEMPFDILFEIFSHFLPCDLLSMSRTSKEFRELVLNPAFKSIWVHSRSHVEELPGCPEDMSEPQYAELAFGKGCLVCGKGGVTISIWEARTRLCYSCIDDTYVTNHYISRLGLPGTLAERVPHAYLRHKQRYSPVYGHKWADEYKALKNPEERQKWKEAKLAEIEIVSLHATDCLDWQRSFARMGSYQKMAGKREREAKIIQLVKSMGWDDDLIEYADLEHDPDIDRLCSRKLTDKGLENARFLLNKIMKDAEEKRTIRERTSLYNSRLEALKNAYTDAVDRWHSPLVLRPRVSDIFTIPRIKSLVIDTPPETTITSSHFNLTKDTLPVLIDEANDLIKQKLLDMVEESMNDKEYDPATVLNLASTVFISQNFGPRNTYMPTWQVLHVKHDSYMYSTERDKIEAIAYEVFKCNPWGHRMGISFNRPIHDAVCKVLTFCGFDPLKATIEEVEKVDPIIECLTCNHVTCGRIFMRLMCAASHWNTSHGQDLNNLSLADDKDASRARAKMNDDDEVTAYREAVKAMCKHCDYTSEISNTRRHIWTQHDITYPGPEDIKIAERVLRVDSCRLWPARPC